MSILVIIFVNTSKQRSCNNTIIRHYYGAYVDNSHFSIVFHILLSFYVEKSTLLCYNKSNYGKALFLFNICPRPN